MNDDAELETIIQDGEPGGGSLVEWAETPDGPMCFQCGSLEEVGHQPGCPRLEGAGKEAEASDKTDPDGWTALCLTGSHNVCAGCRCSCHQEVLPEGGKAR